MRSRLLELLAGAAVIAAVASPANAELVRFVNPNPDLTLLDNGCAASANCMSYFDIGGVGFGAAPRLLTLQTAPLQIGAGIPGPGGVGTATQGDAIAGADKTNVVTLNSLGYATGDLVAIGYDSNQTGNSGITLNQLSVEIYNATGAFVTSFSTSGPIQYSEEELGLQQGNGSGMFIFVLNTAQRAAFNALPGLNGSWLLGVYANMGCPEEDAPVGCQPANDGADSFLAIHAGTVGINPLSTVPIPGAIWLFGSIAAIFGGVRQLLRIKHKRLAAA